VQSFSLCVPSVVFFNTTTQISSDHNSHTFRFFVVFGLVLFVVVAVVLSFLL
jgi:hypothetical protein